MLTEMRALPLSDGCRRRVSLESRYGMCDVFFSLSLEMTCTRRCAPALRHSSGLLWGEADPASTRSTRALPLGGSLWLTA